MRVFRVALGLLLTFGALGWCAQAALATSSPPGVYMTDDESGGVFQFGAQSNGALSPLTPGSVSAPGLQSWGAAVRPNGQSVYAAVSGASQNGIAQWTIGSDGALVPMSPAEIDLPASFSPEGMAISPDGQSLYVTNISDGCGDYYAIDTSECILEFNIGSDGTLTLKSTSAAGAGACPISLAVDHQNNMLYAAEQGCGGSGGLEEYSIGAGGELTAESGVTAPYATSVAVSPDGSSLYVVGANAADTAGMIYQFNISPDGTLSPKTPATVAPPAGYSLNGIAVSPDGSSVYVGGATPAEAACTSATYAMVTYRVGSSGLLSDPSTTAKGGATPSGGIVASADGKAVYAAADNYCRGETSGIDEYSVGSDGTLSKVGMLDAGTDPAWLATTPAAQTSVSPLLTNTAVSCVYQLTGAAAFSDICSGTVGTGSSHVPTGVVEFSSSGGGSFGSSGRCTLSPVSDSATATCAVDFIPPGTAAPTITAAYQGDSQDSPSSGGTNAAPPAPNTARVITSASISPAAILAGASGIPCAQLAPGLSCIARARSIGGRVRFRLLAPAVVTFRVQRPVPGRKAGKRGCVKPTSKDHKRGKCTRWVTLPGKFEITATSAASYSFVFRGRIGHTTLKPGRYRLAATPEIAGVRQLAEYIAFSIR